MEGDKNLADLLAENGYSMEMPNHDLISALPLTIKKRVQALKKVQLKSVEVEAKFYEKVHELEKEFEKEFGVVFEQRRKIVSGEYEPTDGECDIAIIHGATEEEIKALNDASEEDTGKKGIPDFWLNVIKSSEAIGDMVQEHDEPILSHLMDITTTVESEPKGFTLYFHFAPNEYFTNSVLKKQYLLQMGPDAEDPFDYDGPSVTKAVGDTIDWKDGKNVTKKVVKKKQKKGPNAGKFLTKTVKADSFFNFFEPPQEPNPDTKNEDDEEDHETIELMRADFEVGQVMRDHVIPRAVLFYTGEAVEGDMYDDFDGEDDEDEITSDEDEE